MAERRRGKEAIGMSEMRLRTRRIDLVAGRWASKLEGSLPLGVPRFLSIIIPARDEAAQPP